MPVSLIKPPEEVKKTKESIQISVPLMDEINAYCKEGKIEVNYFFECAAQRLLSKDRGWKEAKAKTQEGKGE